MTTAVHDNRPITRKRGRRGASIATLESVGSAPAFMPVSGRILLAEDNTHVREYARGLLSEHCEVEAVADGAAALAAARERRPDLILADVTLPELDGAELLRELRAHPSTRALPVIFLATRESEVPRHEAGDPPAQYLIKPFSAPELLARVMAQLQPPIPVEETTTVEAETPPAAPAPGPAAAFAKRLMEGLVGGETGWFVLDQEWRFTGINCAGARMMRKPCEELAGRSIWEVYPEAATSSFAAELRRAVAEGAPVRIDGPSPQSGLWRELHASPTPAGLSVYWWELPGKDGRTDFTRAKTPAAEPVEAQAPFAPADELSSVVVELQLENEELRGANQELRGANQELRSRQVEIELANSELEARCRMLALHAEVSDALLSHADNTAISANLARAVVSYMADWCVVDVLELNGTARRATAHADPAKAAVVRELQRLQGHQDPLWKAGHVARNGEARLYNTSAELLATGCSAAGLDVLRRLGVGSVMMVPLVAPGARLGVITFG
ncbi:MAG TPA: response regulator, partial [Armatimonadota bacterium]|nr:response regulator [Armatimonadota bacterium]